MRSVNKSPNSFIKKLICILLVNIIFVYAAVNALAFENYSASHLRNCGNVITDSNEYGCFAYGYYGETLYSSMLLPKQSNRYVNVPHNITSVCQSGELTCALYPCDITTNLYGITTLNMNNGAVNNYRFNNLDDVTPKMFSVTEKYAYFIRNDDVYSYVAIYDLNGKYVSKCRFDENIYQIFNNNSKTYVLLNSGTLYCFSGIKYRKIAKITSAAKVYNAGIDNIYMENSMVVSLKNGETKIVSRGMEKCIVKVNDGMYTANNSQLNFMTNDYSYYNINLPKEIKYIAVYKDKIAAIYYNNDYVIVSKTELESNIDFTNTNIDYDFKGYTIEQGRYILGIASSTSVTDFKSHFSDEIAIYNNEGSKITSGKIKTGYKAVIGNDTFTLIVKGDITGEGNVKSNDRNSLMNYIVGVSELNDIQRLAADYDLNGVVDNRDLVYISRTN